MLKLKYRKILFWFLIAILAGGSMAVYSQSEINFFLKTVELVLFQQCAATVLYLTCFGVDLLKDRQ
ncbi:MAG: hypothetical protein ACP5D7_18955 [Limnospira sp.]